METILSEIIFKEKEKALELIFFLQVKKYKDNGMVISIVSEKPIT